MSSVKFLDLFWKHVTNFLGWPIPFSSLDLDSVSFSQMDEWRHLIRLQTGFVQHSSTPPIFIKPHAPCLCCVWTVALVHLACLNLGFFQMEMTAAAAHLASSWSAVYRWRRTLVHVDSQAALMTLASLAHLSRTVNTHTYTNFCLAISLMSSAFCSSMPLMWPRVSNVEKPCCMCCVENVWLYRKGTFQTLKPFFCGFRMIPLMTLPVTRLHHMYHIVRQGNSQHVAWILGFVLPWF